MANVVVEQQEEIEDGAENEQEQLEQPEAGEQQPEESQANGPQSEAEGEVIVTIGDAEPEEEIDDSKAAPWVRELRKKYSDLKKEKRELEEKLRVATPESTAKTVLGKKPTLEDADYDTDKFELELTQWYERKRAIEAEEAAVKAKQEEQQLAWQARIDSYNQAKVQLKVKDYEEAESIIQDTFSKTQQGIMVQGLDNPALVVYALGKNPGKAKELSAIEDPVKLAIAIGKLEKDLKVSNRKAVPAPEKVVQGTGRISGAVDSNLDNLREEAARTGDYSKIMRYKQQQKQKMG